MAETTGGKQQRQGFRPGQSGNPAGRPKGSRHAALLALDAIGEAAAKDVLETVINAAKGGDARSAEIILRRLWPERKGRTIALDLPVLETPADLVRATGAVAGAVADGTITPEEGVAVASVMEIHRKAIETQDLEARLAALEAASRKAP